jgi:phage terminase large subunit GpA-like protein
VIGAVLMALSMAASSGAANIDAIVAQALEAWRPPQRLALSAWAERYFMLSAESAAEPGRWHTLPYQRGIMDAITDPTVTQISLMKSARVGYTKIVDATIGYYIHQDPCPIMVVQPTIDDAKGYSKEEIAPMLRDVAELSAIVPTAKTRESSNTILLKRFPGGSLSIVGANSARGFRRVSRKVVIFDETDGYPPSAGTEGDQIQLGIRRTEYYWDRKIILGSTPTVAGYSRIERLFVAGDQRRYYVPCPHCSTMQVLEFKRFKWPKGRPEAAIYVCLECGSEIEHRHKRDMVEAGEWRPGPHDQFPDLPAPSTFDGHASFHIWAAYSYAPNATWGQICREFVEAEHNGPETLKTFINTGLGETWKDRGEAPDWQRLFSRREGYVIATCPPGVLFLTAGVDVQKDRLVYEVVGWGRDKRSWSIDAGVLPGDTSDLARGPWHQLEALLARQFPHAGGTDLSIAMLAIDSGFNTQTVYNWARQHPMSRVIAVRGVDTAHTLIGAPSPVDVVVSGRKLKRGYKVWPIATNLAKTELYGWLSMQAPSAEDRAAGILDPPGFCHFPEYGEDFFKQLTAEQLVPHRSPKGYTVFAWQLIPGRENHQLDARVYARAASAVVGLDRFTRTDFDTLERRLGIVRSSPLPTPEVTGSGITAPSPAATPATTRPPQRQAPRGSWLGRRSGDWLRGRRS